MIRRLVCSTAAAALAAALAAVIAFPHAAQAQEASFNVSGTAAIHGAGNAGLPEGGSLPPTVTLLPGTRRVLTFSRVTGVVNLDFAKNNGPDGGNYGGFITNVDSFGGISGILDNQTNSIGALYGVFTAGPPPVGAAPPPRLDITGMKNQEVFSPQLNQIFFIGDALTGTGAGAPQEFFVPDGATHLSLGIVDANPIQGTNGQPTPPSSYSNNGGFFAVTLSVTPASAAAPWTATALSTGFDNRTRMVWRHTTGAISFWTVSPDGQHEGYQSYGPFPGWTAALLAVGADNRSRLLWSHPGGVASLWSLSPLGLFENFVEHGPYPDWSPVALSAGADNLTRLLWEHMTGAVSLHLLSPTGVFQSYQQHGPFPGWKATAMGTGGDNRTRLLWTHGESGTVSLHTLSPNGAFQMHSAFGPYPGWTAALLDVGKSDNRTRLVWRHTSSGAISFWTLSPNGVFEMHSAYGPYPGWTATAISVGADNRTRLIWSHDTGAISLWLLSPNGQFERHVQYGPF